MWHWPQPKTILFKSNFKLNKIKRSKSGFIVLLIACLSILPAQRIFALSSQDIVIVFNANMPESEDVARYYAAKRGVPFSNMVSVKVSSSETILRSDFESNIVLAVRPTVIRMKKAGKTPAILLVYGIPLRVKEQANFTHDSQFNLLTENKVKEYQDLVLKLSYQLDHVIKKNQPTNTTKTVPRRDGPSSTKNILDRANRSLLKTSEYLSASKQDKRNLDNNARAASILIRLGGLSPIAKGVFKKALSNAGKWAQFTLRNDNLLKWNAILEQQLIEIQFRGVLPGEAQKVASIIRIVNGLVGELNFWDHMYKIKNEKMTSASVDSELTMILSKPYQTAKWLPNPFLKNFDKIPDINRIRENRVMVGRLDGPRPDLAKRLVDDAIAVEKTGLSGTFYIDARGLKGDNSYSQYDEHLRNLYKILKEKSTLPVVLDNKPDLFPENSAPNAALYAGWYSLGKYVDSFKWEKGAIGFHIASAEAKTLKQPGSMVWCKRMIEEGVAATLGPVDEPFLDSFPLPDVFFPLLMSGKFSLLEVYFQSTPFLSWRQILIGDPLYIPFKNNPAIKD